jgi:hypothetical protein
VVRESSALQKSRTQDDVFWTLSDSGNPPVLYALNALGEVLQSFEVEGAFNRDWEALALDDAGHLYIGDVGNNANRRRDLVVYKVAEPKLSEAPPRGTAPPPVEILASLPIRYREQEQPPEGRRRDFDAEALFWARGELFLLTKERTGRGTVLYRFDTTEAAGDGMVPLLKLGRFELGDDAHQVAGTVTAADASPDGNTLAVLAYRALYLFARPAGGDNYLAADPILRIALTRTVTQQCEGITWDGADLLFSNEQGDLHRIVAPLERRPLSYP